MNDIERIIESKYALRRELNSLPIVEKLRLLDELHQRALVLKRSSRSVEGDHAIHSDAE